MLMLRGRMVPTRAFSPGAERGQFSHLAADSAGYVDTRFSCQLNGDNRTLTITAPPAGTTAVGAYRFLQNEVDELIAKANPNATIVALPDADLGQRFAGAVIDRGSLIAKLQASGTNPLITRAFKPRGSADAA
jgi:hypothetical protein